MKNIKLILISVFALLATTLQAQNIKVSGVISDAYGPVAGATVLVQGSSTGTSSDAAGKYSITAPSKGVLVVTCVGYIDEAVAIEGRSSINITIKEDSQLLESAVSVGYGSAKKPGNLVGSVTTVNAATIKNAPSNSALDKLQGQVAGLQVLSTGGVAGDNNVSIKLHGVGSLGASSAPLYIVDGVPASSSAIMQMNPNDILSISVLKDASATSIYGSRAANGVIFVTTKAGAFNSKASVTVRSQYGISTLADLTLYKNMMSGDELKDFWIRSGLMTPEAIAETYTDKGYDANTEWWRYAQQMNNPQYQNEITFEGGSDKVAYLVGASQYHQRGTTRGNFYDRYTVRSNVQAHPNNWIKFGMNVNLSLEKNRQNGNWGDSTGGESYTYGGLSYLLLPLYPAIDPITGKEYAEQYPNGLPAYEYYADKISDIYSYYGLVGSAFVLLEPVRGLRIQSRIGTESQFTYRDYKRKASYYGNIGNGQRATQWYVNSTNTISNTIEYAPQLGSDHEFTILAGQEGTVYDYWTAFASGTNLTDDRLLTLDNTNKETRSTSEDASGYKFLSFFGHAEYMYQNKYIIDASIRNDASSRFGPKSRNAQFWSLGGKWRASKESFLKDNPIFNDLNVKLSYGTQGNAAIGNYRHLGLVGAGTNYQGLTSLVLSQPSNPKLTWEKQRLFTAGVSGRAIDMIDFEIEFYNRQTNSMLMSVPQPYTTGFSSLYNNVGGLNNKGIDLTLGVDILRGRDYYLRFNTTFNYNKQKVTELFDGRKEWEIANTFVKYIVGEPVMYFAPIYAGVNPENGNLQWYLPGDDINVTTMDPERVTETFNKEELTQNTGKLRHAPVYGGFGLSGAWKGFSVAADFSYVLGKYLLNNDAYFYMNPGDNLDSTQHKAVQDFWTPENPDAKYPNWASGQKMQFDTHVLENASFLRLKSLQVAYSVPRKILGGDKAFVKDLKLTFTGRNLFILTKYTGIDPEVDSNITYGIPGNSKQLLGGIEIVF